MDCIKIENLEVFANHGVFKEENVLGQKFLISLCLYTDIRKAGKTDELEYSTSYADVATFVKKIVEENTFKLIEKVAEEIAEKILLNYRLIEKVAVEVKKPWAPVMLHTDCLSVSIERGWKTVYLSIGSNIGDKSKYLDFAVSELQKSDFCDVVKVSDYIVTAPVGGVEQDDFLNAGIKLKTLLSPYEFLEFINKIEAMAGRERIIHWGPRTLDIDIIFYEDLIINDEKLKIPHIEMENREFVLEPLCQIEPFFKHPAYNITIKELLRNIQQKNL